MINYLNSVWPEFLTHMCCTVNVFLCRLCSKLWDWTTMTLNLDWPECSSAPERYTIFKSYNYALMTKVISHWCSFRKHKYDPNYTDHFVIIDRVFVSVCAWISSLSSTRSWSLIQTTSQNCWRKSTSGSCAAAGRRSSGAACLWSNVGWNDGTQNVLLKQPQTHDKHLQRAGMIDADFSIY